MEGQASSPGECHDPKPGPLAEYIAPCVNPASYDEAAGELLALLEEGVRQPMLILPDPSPEFIWLKEFKGLDSFLPGEIIDALNAQGGSFVLRKLTHEWVCAVEFGEEEPGSPMVAGAAYGLGATPEDAMVNAARDLGRK